MAKALDRELYDRHIFTVIAKDNIRGAEENRFESTAQVLLSTACVRKFLQRCYMSFPVPVSSGTGNCDAKYWILLHIPTTFNSNYIKKSTIVFAGHGICHRRQWQHPRIHPTAPAAHYRLRRYVTAHIGCHGEGYRPGWRRQRSNRVFDDFLHR